MVEEAEKEDDKEYEMQATEKDIENKSFEELEQIEIKSQKNEEVVQQEVEQEAKS